MRQRLPAFAVLCAALLLATACAGSGNANTTGSSQSDAGNASIITVDEQVAPQLPVTITSADGREVTVTDTSRIVPLWGSITEVVFGLGLGDSVVGRDISATFPEAADLPVVTRAHDISAESVLSLHPALVLAAPDSGPKSALDQIRSVGVPVLTIADPTSIDGIAARIREIAAALGVPEAGEALVAKSDAQLAEARASIPDGAATPRVAFLYMRGTAGVYLIAGPGSGADSMIAAAGGIDAGTEMGLEHPFTPLTSEALAGAAPDVILMTTTGLESVGGIDGLVKIPGIAQTPAGKQRRVITMEDGLLYSFGPRTPGALEMLISKLHGGDPQVAR